MREDPLAPTARTLAAGPGEGATHRAQDGAVASALAAAPSRVAGPGEAPAQQETVSAARAAEAGGARSAAVASAAVASAAGGGAGAASWTGTTPP